MGISRDGLHIAIHSLPFPLQAVLPKTNHHSILRKHLCLWFRNLPSFRDSAPPAAVDPVVAKPCSSSIVVSWLRSITSILPAVC